MKWVPKGPCAGDAIVSDASLDDTPERQMNALIRVASLLSATAPAKGPIVIEPKACVAQGS